jgi:ABC-type multidrug transport system fused ATPase/permease subunit
MPVPWFEDQQHGDGHIGASLENDCRIVNSIFTTYMARLIMNISTLIFGISMALYYEWRTALVALGLLPLIIISQAVQMAYSNGLSESTDRSLK